VSIDVVDEERPQKVETHFELAARRLADGWLRAGHFHVSAGDFRLAREFLERTGLNVTELPGLVVQLRTPRGAAEEMTREEAVVVALQRLARRAAGAPHRA
jgi:hypothetical protein